MCKRALFDHPLNLAVDICNNVYVTDTSNNSIRKITPDGSVSTLIGKKGDTLKRPDGIVVDDDGNVYVADAGNSVIRKISKSEEGQQIVSIVAGSLKERGYVDGSASISRFVSPQGLTIDSNGNLYVLDSCNRVVRKITKNLQVLTVAGTGERGLQDTKLGVNPLFSYPIGITHDRSGNLYVTDAHCIRKICYSAQRNMKKIEEDFTNFISATNLWESKPELPCIFREVIHHNQEIELNCGTRVKLNNEILSCRCPQLTEVFSSVNISTKNIKKRKIKL